jgi:hypothetical protein
MFIGGINFNTRLEAPSMAESTGLEITNEFPFGGRENICQGLRLSICRAENNEIPGNSKIQKGLFAVFRFWQLLQIYIIY